MVSRLNSSLHCFFFAICFAPVLYITLNQETTYDSILSGEYHLDDNSAEGVRARRIIFVLWVVLYAFVGSQMAWTLSPFRGAQGEPFIIVTQVGGNFYADVINSLKELLGT